MECDRGTRGQPASDGSRQGFFGGVRRCTERATNIYAGHGGESSSGELERLRKRAARLGRLRTSFKRKWRSSCEYADTQVEQARKQERRVESMLTTNLQYVLIDGEQKRNMEDMRIERSANLLAIEVLQAGLSPIEERLAAELRVSNDLAACLRRQLTDIAASQDEKSTSRRFPRSRRGRADTEQEYCW